MAGPKTRRYEKMQTGCATRSVTTFPRVSKDGRQNMQHIPSTINRLLSSSTV